MNAPRSTLTIRAERPSNYRAIAQVHTHAFGQPDEAQLVERIRASDRYIAELSLVAELEGNVVGHVLFSYVDLVGDAIAQVLSLAPVGVIPDVQSQGIGSALIHTGLGIADSMGEGMVIVLGHPRFYTRFGFEPASQYRIYPPFQVPDDAFMVKVLSGYTCCLHGKIAYPSTFDPVT